jgi:drug/metabolite transporter (DMT)-like permease
MKTPLLADVHAPPIGECSTPTQSACAEPESNDRSGRVRGLVYVASSSLLFGCVAVSVKYLALPPVVFLLFRSVVQWLLSISLLARMRATGAATGPWQEQLWAPPAVRPIVLARGVAFFLFLLLWWNALSWLPVGDATAIVYCWPCCSAVYAVLLLRERPPWTVYPSAALALGGVWLIADPEGHAVDSALGVASAAAAAFVGALCPVLARWSRRVHWSTIEHVSSSTSIAGGALVLGGSVLLHGLPPLGPWGPARLAVLLAAPLVGFAALALQTIGFQQNRASEASMVAFLEASRAPQHSQQHAQRVLRRSSALRAGARRLRGAAPCLRHATVGARAARRRAGARRGRRHHRLARLLRAQRVRLRAHLQPKHAALRQPRRPRAARHAAAPLVAELPVEAQGEEPAVHAERPGPVKASSCARFACTTYTASLWSVAA